jgi:hypothetical protein
VVDSPVSIVLLGINRNKVGSTGRCRCRLLKRESTQIGALVGKITLLTIDVALLISQRYVLSSLGRLNILISSSRSLEIIGALNHLMLRGREPLSN